jgi:cytochrome c oxidase cbb3-type subunit 4
MTYQDVLYVSETYGLVYLVVMFAVVLAYALWPRNKKKFDRAARMPLEED